VGTIAGDPLGVAFLRSLDRNFEFTMSLGGNLVDHLGEAYRGVVLTEVRRKQVVFSRGTKTWTLDLGEDPLGASPPARVAVPRPVTSPAAPAPPATGGAAAGQRVVNRAEVEQNLKNLGYLITQLNVQPFFQNGQPSGFRVSRIRPGSFVDKMGARNGDIIQGVNGKPIRTIKDAFLLYNSFKTQSSVQVNVLRNGQPTTMGFQLR
jgi:general secretion pathway protein C